MSGVYTMEAQPDPRAQRAACVEVDVFQSAAQAIFHEDLHVRCEEKIGSEYPYELAPSAASAPCMHSSAQPYMWKAES
jgi:hypothetical protein